MQVNANETLLFVFRCNNTAYQLTMSLEQKIITFYISNHDVSLFLYSLLGFTKTLRNTVYVTTCVSINSSSLILSIWHEIIYNIELVRNDRSKTSVNLETLEKDATVYKLFDNNVHNYFEYSDMITSPSLLNQSSLYAIINMLKDWSNRLEYDTEVAQVIIITVTCSLDTRNFIAYRTKKILYAQFCYSPLKWKKKCYNAHKE